MSAALLQRVRRMSGEEIAWRARVIARTHGQRLAARVRQPRWDRRDLRGALAADVLDAAMRGAMDRGDWPSVQHRLEERLRSRPARFVLDPNDADSRRRLILARWPDAGAASAARADRALRGDLDLLGYRGVRPVDAENAVDWHFDPVHNRRAPARFWADVPYLDPAVGDHKVIWELNRHQHWLQLGRALWLTHDNRYASGITSQLAQWLDANPPLTGINWASMLEIGFRTISWVAALHFLLASGPGLRATGSRSLEPEASSPTPWLVDMLVAIDRQLTHLEQNLSYYFSPNTHLTGEALGLYVAGAALPELAGSARWTATGRRVLLREIDRQILADGGHAERSTHYQRYTLDFYLLALLTAERAGDTEAATAFRDAVARLATFTRAMADDQGRLPLIGDDDGGMLWPLTGRDCNDVRDSLGLAAAVLDRPALAPWGVTEEQIWLGGDRAARLEAAPADAHDVSRTLGDTGYVVMRDRDGRHLVFDVGEHGYMNSGHAHADALAITLTAGGRPLLVDPGTFTYTMDPEVRDAMRSSAHHNTLTIGERSQSSPNGPFHWRTRTDATLHASRHNRAFDWAEGWHDGYAPLRHRRSVVRLPEGVLVVDEVFTPQGTRDSTGSSDARLHWHFDPAWMVTLEDRHRLRARHLDGDEAWVVSESGTVTLAHGDSVGGAWHAPAYGTLLPTWRATVAVDGGAPCSHATWIEDAAGRDDAPVVERITPEGDPASASHVIRIARGDRTSIVMLRPGDAPEREARGCRVLDYQTDARVLHYSVRGGRFRTLDLIDARQALALRDGWLSVSSDDPIADVHVECRDGVLALEASHPPGSIRLEGGAIAASPNVRLNGRAVPVADTHGDTLIVTSAQWAGPEAEKGERRWEPSPAL